MPGFRLFQYQGAAGTVRITGVTAKTLGRAPGEIRFQGPACRTLRDMDPEEIKALEQRYGAPVVQDRRLDLR